MCVCACRTCFQTAHFYVDDSSSPRVTGPCSTFPSASPASARPPPGDQTAFSASQFVKHVEELHTTQGFPREFQVSVCVCVFFNLLY